MSAITTALAIGGWLLRCKACLAVLAALGLLVGGGIYGVTVERSRAEARIEKMKRDADVAADQRDAQLSKKLDEKYQPQIGRLQAEKATLEEKVKDYAKRKPAVAAAKPRTCKLGDAAGLLQPSRSR